LNTTNKQSLKILQYNVNKSRTKVLMGLLQDPEIASYDIIATQEPWRNPFNNAPYNPRSSPFHTSDQGDKDSRVCTYINKRIQTDKWSETHHTKDFTTITLRTQGVQTEHDQQELRTINIHNVYNQQSSHSETQETESLRTLREALKMPGEHIIIGDLNLHHPSWGGPSYPMQHKLADNLLDIVRDADLNLTLPQGTITRDCQRGNNHEQTTIDLVFTTAVLEQQVVRCGVEMKVDQSSDHLPICTEFEWERMGKTKESKSRRAWKSMNIEKFSESLNHRTEHLEDRPLTTRAEINQLTYELIKDIKSAVEDSTPWARPSEWSKSYWTAECQEAVKQTRAARRRFTQDPSAESWEEFVQERNRKGKILGKAKRDDFRNVMQDAATRSEGIWKIVRWAKQRSQKQTTQIAFPTLRQGLYEAKDAESKAKLLRDTCFPPPPEVDLDDIEGFHYPLRIPQQEEITEREILKAVNRTSKDKAPGPDELPNRVIQIVVRRRTPLIRRLFQACLDQGVQPDHFKNACTVMLKKPGKSDYTNPSAYRPIALLNTLGKVLEAVISNRIKFIAETHDLLPDTQYGARTNRATETALQQITEKIHTIWGRGGKRVASLLSLDVSKAFDRVSHVRLVHNLRKRRIPESLVRWVEDFLSGRRTEVKVNDFVLPEAPVSVGIPQGSPISPILYLFYNADLLESCESLRLRTSTTGFVDDVNILTYSESTEQNCKKLAEIHMECQKWARKHGSQFCPDKYELIHFSRTKKKFNMSAEVRLEGQSVGPKTDIRILGVRLDSALRWQAHMRAVEAKAVHLVNALRTITGSTWGCSLEAGKQVYETAVRPAITYAASVWHAPEGVKGHRKGIRAKLQKIQGKCLRTIAGAYKATSTEALEVETFTLPLDLHTERLAARTAARIHTTKAAKGIKSMCNRIHRQTAGRRGRLAIPRSSPLDCMNAWTAQLAPGPDAQENPSQGIPQPPWEKHEKPPPSKRLVRLYEGITSYYKDKWKDRWKAGKKGAHSRHLWPAPSRRTMEAHTGMKKHESALLTQLRTGKVGFNAFLHSMRVPDIQGPECDCQEGDMTVEHVLLKCPQWNTERAELISPLCTNNLKEILTTKSGGKAATRFVRRIGILDQFRAVVEQGREEHREEDV